ncbi:MAG: hypothetical protein H8D54_04490 [Candidatus Omnitrophica bacterium]|nr:hypothetical protein [Candidatus Omnitrophota bacterium]
MSIWFIVAGLILRLWANGYAIKMDKLTTSGPYSFVRHPLYLGTMLIIIGFVVMVKIYYIGVLFVILTTVVYHDTVKKEEAMLEKSSKRRISDIKQTSAVYYRLYPLMPWEKSGRLVLSA